MLMSRIVLSRESGHVAGHVMPKSRFSRCAAWLNINFMLLLAPPLFIYVVLNRDIEAFYRASERVYKRRFACYFGFWRCAFDGWRFAVCQRFRRAVVAFACETL